MKKKTNGYGDNVKIIKKESESISNTTSKLTQKSTAEPQNEHVPFNKNPRTFGLDETLIPEGLKDKAKILLVRGDLKGWFFLLPYDGKLRDFTDKPTEQYYALLKRNGQKKRVIVSVSKSDKIIYIYGNFYNTYKQGINDLIELALPS